MTKYRRVGAANCDGMGGSGCVHRTWRKAHGRRVACGVNCNGVDDGCGTRQKSGGRGAWHTLHRFVRVTSAVEPVSTPVNCVRGMAQNAQFHPVWGGRSAL